MNQSIDGLSAVQAGTHAFFEKDNHVVVLPLKPDTWRFKLASALSGFKWTSSLDFVKSNLPVADPAKIHAAILALQDAASRAKGAEDRPPQFKSLQERVITAKLPAPSGTIQVPERIARGKLAVQLALNLEANARTVIRQVDDAIVAAGTTGRAFKDKWSLTPDNMSDRLTPDQLEHLARSAPDDNGLGPGKVTAQWIRQCNIDLFSQRLDSILGSPADSADARPVIDRQAITGAYAKGLTPERLRESGFQKPSDVQAEAERLLVEGRAIHLYQTLGIPVPKELGDVSTHPDLARLADDDRPDRLRALMSAPAPTAAESQAIGQQLVRNAVVNWTAGLPQPQDEPQGPALPGSLRDMSARHQQDATELLARLRAGAPVTDAATAQAALEQASRLVETHLPILRGGLVTIDHLSGHSAQKREQLIDAMYRHVSTTGASDLAARARALDAHLTEAARQPDAPTAGEQQAFSSEATDVYAQVAHGETRNRIFGDGADASRQVAIRNLAGLGYDADQLEALAGMLDKQLEQQFDSQASRNSETLRAAITRDYQRKLQEMVTTLQVPGLNGAMVVASLMADFNALRVACKVIASDGDADRNHLKEASQALRQLADGVRGATIRNSARDNLRDLLKAELNRQFSGQPERMRTELADLSKGLAALIAQESSKKSVLGIGGPNKDLLAALGGLAEGAGTLQASLTASR